ncbi:Tad domain-containing protein [candidate division KSB1 bacterium]|nr:Tad domain-containing protein [candidate division KSB1 bacterium]
MRTLKKLKNLIKSKKGSVVVISALFMLVLMMIAALTIDTSRTFAARNELQNAVDAAALAGASGFVISNSKAVSRAIEFAGLNTCNNYPVSLAWGDISFPSAQRIRVQHWQPVPTCFARVIGMMHFNIFADASAELAPLIATNKLKPLCVPDQGWDLGDPVIIKMGDIYKTYDPDVVPETPNSFYYPVDFPAINRGDPETGASVFNEFFIGPCPYMVYIGDELLIEPGNMTGPTKKAVDAVINMDPNAYWDGTGVSGSRFPDNQSPRIIHIPLYSKDNPPVSGRSSVFVTAFAAFFLSNIDGKCDVIGIFMKDIADGIAGNNPLSLLMKIQLVE